LALVQAGLVAERLRELEVETEIRVIVTEGDRRQDISLRGNAGAGLFVREIERALQEGAIDLAVHSLKDLPVEMAPGLCLTAFLKRDDPREAFLSSHGCDFFELQSGSVIGSSSLRRVAQLQKLRPDLTYRDIRGNVDTRLGKLEEGHYQGIILAVAGLARLGLERRINRIFKPSECLPAAGQGVIAVQIRENSSFEIELGNLNDSGTALAVRAERTFLAKLGGGCRLPIGVLAEVSGVTPKIAGMVANSTGTQLLNHQIRWNVDQPEAAGTELAEWFLTKGIVDWC
jgi:hydroxymethylbilane synthase